MARVRVDGKHFAVGSERFQFRGVTYGTFRPRGDGARFPERDRLKLDLQQIHEADFTVLRTYTEPPADLLDLASDWDLRVLAGAFYPDWRYLVGASRREQARVLREARAEVRSVARRLAGNEQVLAVGIGNEIPADVIRWTGTTKIARALADLAEVVREEDETHLVTYANYPTAEYLPLDTLDFLTFNVFLERRVDFRKYLTRLHHLAGDRPLVLGEIGLHVGDGPEAEQRQADFLDWQFETAIERGVAGMCVFSWTDEWWVGDAAVEGWHFGLTREDRTPRPALEIVQSWNRRTVADLRDADEWTSVSVVVCAYNASETLDECLRHTCALDYPNLEIIVVDDGSTDDTAAITRRHPRARLHTIEHGGLSVARNEGYRIAAGEIVAYLDSDAYPSQEWPYYLVLGFDEAMVGGVGGPNVPPVDDPFGAQQVAQAPGGPVHVLLSDDRAEHIPGCNMAFWREVLQQVGGCDPVYTAAGDDVDLCWKVLDTGWEIGFHPAALVWHHRRSGFRRYLRQQRGYGRSEALVEARHPDRFTALGTARWHGSLYDFRPVALSRQRVYRGLYGTAAYQSVYRGGGHALDIAHQLGVPAAGVALLTAPLAMLTPLAGLPAVAAVALLIALAVLDFRRSSFPRTVAGSALRFRLGVVAMQLAQPVVRTWSRWRQTADARRAVAAEGVVPAASDAAGRGALIYPALTTRAEFAASVVDTIRGYGLRVVPATGWEAHDGTIATSFLTRAEVLSTAYPEGCFQLRILRRIRVKHVVFVAAVAAVFAALEPAIGAAILIVLAIDVSVGFARTGRRLRRRLRGRQEGT